MPNAQLINRSDLSKEPKYNTPDDAISPVKKCAFSNEEKNPKQKIVKAYFTNLDGEKLEKITKEKEIYLVVETENMSGEEVIINLPEHYGDFKYEGEEFTKDKVLQLNVSGDTEKIKLETIARRKEIPQTPVAKESVQTPGSTAAAIPTFNEDANIVFAEFLDGADDKILSADGEQYVNLPFDDKWVDGIIVKNKDRLSRRPRILVKFDKHGKHSFKIKLVTGVSNTIYSDNEKNNAKFEYEENELSYTTGGDGTKIIDDLFVTVAGNDKYAVSASDSNGNIVVSSYTITTKRFFYYIETKMKGLKTVATSLSSFETEFNRNFMKLQALKAVEMKYMENISKEDEDNFENNCRSAYQTSEAINKEPYCVTIAYTDQLAVKNPKKIIRKRNVDVGPGQSNVIINVEGPGLTNPDVETRALWNDIVAGEGWFVSCKYLKAGGRRTDKIEIAEDKCIAQIRAGFTDFYDKVSIAVDHLPKGKGQITLRVNWVDRMRAGLSFPKGNLVCVCTRAWWQNESTASQNEVIIHEVGHKVGMVSDGGENLPDKVSTHYDDSKGHVGDHCHFGIPKQARYDGTGDSSKAKCVMYGAITSTPRFKFCRNCHPTVLKLDISSGWKRL